jgi:predicted aspartyl protease
MPLISWRHDHRRILMPIAIFPSLREPNATQTCTIRGLVDTGATGTGIRRNIIDQLSLPIKGYRRVGTANGDIKATEHLIRIGMYPGEYNMPDYNPPEIMPFVIERELLVYSLHPQFTYAAIIGMDVIAAGEFCLNSNGTVSLFVNT